MGTFSERLRASMDSANMKAVELHERTGISKASISEYLSGNYEPKQRNIFKIAQALNVSPSYLMGVNDDPRSPVQSPAPASGDLPDLPNIFPIRTKKVPLLGTIAAGVPIYADENFDGYRECTEDVDADFCLKIHGDSMIGARINDGDIVFIKKQPDVDNGEIAAVLIEDEATLKRVYKEKDSLILQAENPKYAPLVCTAESYVECRIMGKAVAFQSDIV